MAWPSGRAGWTQQTLSKLKAYLVNLAETTDIESWRIQLSLEYKALQQADEMVAYVESQLDALAKADQRVRRLRTIPGVGRRLAELVVAKALFRNKRSR